MTAALLVILFKIVVTFVFVAIPFLFFPAERLNKVTGIAAKSVTFYRLYGVAMLALLIGYASAFPLLWQNIFPWAVVIMGIVSNTGVTLVLVRGRSLSCKSPFVLTYGGIAIMLILCATFPKVAITPIF